MAAAVIPLFVITGPTASGKTALALDLAKKYGGEIVCADSRTVYKGLDVGTAKPTADGRRRVPHHLLDIVDPDEPYNLARFQADARAAVADIRRRGKVPFLVGGSGLYVDSIVLDYELGDAPDTGTRVVLESMTLEDLLRYSNDNNIMLPDNLYNKRYVIRAIEQGGININRNTTPVYSTFVVAIKNNNDILKQRISRRAEALFDNGLEAETRAVSAKYGWDIAPLRAPAYAAMRRYIDGSMSHDDAVIAFARADWQLARKQMTWLRRHPWITWLAPEDVDRFVARVLVTNSND